jgi:hypothetical protein
MEMHGDTARLDHLEYLKTLVGTGKKYSGSTPRSEAPGQHQRRGRELDVKGFSRMVRNGYSE